MQLASKFSHHANALRSDLPLCDDQIRSVAPSIFAMAKHASRSARYTYIPTIDILRGLRKEGFMPFMACQSRTRSGARRSHTKHMVRLRPAGQIARDQANEIILLNSHDGSSSYQMLAGVFRFVCQNGLVCGDILSDIRIAHKGNITDNVIDGAFQVLNDFARVTAATESMRAVTLTGPEQSALARAALALRYDAGSANAAAILPAQLLQPRRFEDTADDLWTTLNRTQENLIAGGLPGRSANGRRTTTRPVTAIDHNIKLNRALWILAQEMQKLKN